LDLRAKISLGSLDLGQYEAARQISEGKLDPA
jgi:hypothetical protein